jgi:predicted RNA-binding Zn ribbon-like protein
MRVCRSDYEMNTDHSNRGFKFIGGFLCLDFINTVEGRSSNSHQRKGCVDDYQIVGEKLANYSDVVAWCRHEQAALLSTKDARHLIELAERHPRSAHTVFEKAIGLREALYRVFKAVTNGRRPAQTDVETLNDELKRARAHEKLVFSGETVVTAWDNMSDALESPLWPVARSAAELLTSGDSSRLRQCVGEDCGWLFVDTSRNGSRQWCDMKDCGNLAKVRRFRERQQEA